MYFNNFYKYSWFSNMSYVLWDETNINNPIDIIAAASGDDSQRLPEELGGFVFGQEGWTIPSFYPTDDTGFAANVFTNGDEKVLAIRGTDEFFEDLLQADILQIGTIGLALDQSVRMFNYIQLLQGTGNEVLQLSLRSQTVGPAGSSPVPLDGEGNPLPSVAAPAGDASGSTTYYWFEASNTGQGLGVLSPGDNVTVTGHSLGGHLGMLAIRLFPDLFDQSISFNAPGFDPVVTSLALTDEFVGLFSNYLTSPPAASFTELEGRLMTIESEGSHPDDDISVVSNGLITGAAPSSETFIHVENTSHSMDQMMDALAVHALIELIDPDLTPEQVFALYGLASNQGGNTEESFLNSLSALFLPDKEPLTAVVGAGIISHGDFSVRSANHDRILELTVRINEFIAQNPTGGGINTFYLENLQGVTAESLAVSAQNGDRGILFALVTLSPFVVRATNTGAVNALYQPFGDLLNIDNYSEQYLQDRADFLSLVITRNYGDLSSENMFANPDQHYFEDLESGTLITTGTSSSMSGDRNRIIFGSDTGDLINGGSEEDHLYGGNGNDVISSGNGGDYIEGGYGNDILSGGGESDILIGGEGGDMLDGGNEEDTLYANRVVDPLLDDHEQDTLIGGDGADTYYVNTGDVIEDDDGTVYLNDELVAFNGTRIAEGSDYYRDAVTGAIVRANLFGLLYTDANGAYFTVNNAVSTGAFGITLNEFVAPVPPTGSAVPVGDINDPNAVNVLTQAGDYLAPDPGSFGVPAGHVIGLAVEYQGETIINAGDGLDRIETGETHPNAVHILGGAGNDQLYSGTGNDVIEGGLGRDLIGSMAGDDVLYGNDDQDAMDGGSGNDVLDGGAGNLSTGLGNVLAGSGGNDLLIGGDCKGSRAEYSIQYSEYSIAA